MTTRSWFYLCVMFVTSTWFLYRVSLGATVMAIRPGIINSSEIKVSPTSRDDKQVFTFRCSGQIGAEANLEEVGISKSDLLRGIQCIAGDFDGNGFLDFAFTGKPARKDSNLRPFKIVYFGDHKIINSELIKDKRISYLWLYPPHSRPGEHGEPASNSEGLFQPSDDGGFYIFLYNSAIHHLESHMFPRASL